MPGESNASGETNVPSGDPCHAEARLIFLASLTLIGTASYWPSADKPALCQLQAGGRLATAADNIKFGQVTAVATDSADRVHVFHRGKHPVVVFDAGGKYLRSWGDGLIKTAHGLRIDRDDNVWLTDLGHHLS